MNLIRVGVGEGQPIAGGPPAVAPTGLRRSHVARWDYDAAADAFLPAAERWLQHGAAAPASAG